jgi:Rha family phage regulatory protein
VSEKETLSMSQTIKATGLSRSTITRALKRDDGSFPKPVRSGERGNMYFDREDVHQWAAARSSVRDMVKSFEPPADFMDVVRMIDNQAMTTSLDVAKRYGKQHKDVLRKYDSRDCSEEFSRRNFAPSEYVDERGKTQRMIRMTKDGFMFLVARFTGKAAGETLEKYIACFNAMARYISELKGDLQALCDVGALQRMDKMRSEASHHASGLATLGHRIRRGEAGESSAIGRLQLSLPFEDQYHPRIEDGTGH